MIILGDLYLDGLRPNKREGKVLTDMEMEQGLECLISKPTRTETRGTKTSSTLKASDSLHPPLMMSKLKAYGFEDTAINLLRSYLCN